MTFKGAGMEKKERVGVAEEDSGPSLPLGGMMQERFAEVLQISE